MSVEPIEFAPYLRPQVWGGRTLESRLNKHLPDAHSYGESWEISAHPDHVTSVLTGPSRGRGLDQLWRDHASQWTQGRVSGTEPFPLLLKWLDCRDLLSVQVHPNDTLARELRNEQFGKTEAWIVVDAEPTSRIFAGLKPGITPEILRQHLDRGTVADCLHAFLPHPGDCLFIPAGTVHAVGGGVLMAEVQQSSDATFRLFDWNRPGSDGKLRPLHIDESLQSIRWDAGPVDPVVPWIVRDDLSHALRERLVNCEQFRMERWTLCGNDLSHPFPDNLSLVMVLAGDGTFAIPGQAPRPVIAGRSLLVPAGADSLTWHGAGLVMLFAIPVFTST